MNAANESSDSRDDLIRTKSTGEHILLLLTAKGSFQPQEMLSDVTLTSSSLKMMKTPNYTNHSSDSDEDCEIDEPDSDKEQDMLPGAAMYESLCSNFRL